MKRHDITKEEKRKEKEPWQEKWEKYMEYWRQRGDSKGYL